MGSQIRFFLAPADVSQLENEIRACGAMKILLDKFEYVDLAGIRRSTVDTLAAENQGLCLVREEDIADLEFRPISKTAQRYCDGSRSPIIEYYCGFAGASVIRSGRLYRIDSYYDKEGKKVRKSQDFIHWANRVFRKVKNHLQKIEDGYYAGAIALEMRKHGVNFEGIDSPISVAKSWTPPSELKN